MPQRAYTLCGSGWQLAYAGKAWQLLTVLGGVRAPPNETAWACRAHAVQVLRVDGPEPYRVADRDEGAVEMVTSGGYDVAYSLKMRCA